MKLLEFSLAESFDRENPWVRMLVLRKSGGRIRDAWHWAGLAIVMLLPIAWVIALWRVYEYGIVGKSGEHLTLVASGTMQLLLMVAYMAPASGVGARARLERSPLLADSLMTGLPWRAHVAGAHGRVLVGTISASVLAVTAVVAATVTMWNRNEHVHHALNSSMIPLITDFIDRFNVASRYAGRAEWAFMVLLAAMALNFVVGFYARASLLVTVPPPWPAFAASALILALPVWAAFRWTLISWLLELLKISVSDTKYFLMVAAVELASVAFRLLLARFGWKYVLRMGLHRFKKLQGWD